MLADRVVGIQPTGQALTKPSDGRKFGIKVLKPGLLLHVLSLSLPVSVSLSLCLPLSLSMSVCLSVYLFVSVSVSVCLSLSLSLSLCFSVSVSLCMLYKILQTGSSSSRNETFTLISDHLFPQPTNFLSARKADARGSGRAVSRPVKNPEGPRNHQTLTAAHQMPCQASRYPQTQRQSPARHCVRTRSCHVHERAGTAASFD